MKMHLKAALATVLMLAGGAATAADLPSAKYLPKAPLLPSLYSWTGFYVGAQGGYSWGTDKTRELLTTGRLFINEFEYHPNSVFGGGHAGFNYQMGALVLGVEGDIEAMHARSGFQDPARVRSAGDPGGLVRVQQDWQASVRARIGYAFDRFMVYGTAGAAFTSFDYSYYNPLAGFGEGAKVSKTGWTVGGGVNYALTNNIILGLDYRYTEFSHFDYVANSAFLGLTAEQHPSSQAVRASVAYKF